MGHDKSVSILGAKTLNHYTQGILRKGFEKKGWKVQVETLPTKEGALGNISPYTVCQIHGAPQSFEDDQIIINLLQSSLQTLKTIVLLHRPDEIQIRDPRLKEVLSQLNNTALVFFGNLHIDDSFYSQVKTREVIPHGFFDLEAKFQESPIVVGSQTTWGEMRSLKQALTLIGEIFKLNQETKQNIIGYLGGIPKEEVNFSNISQLNSEVNSGLAINFQDVNQLFAEKIENMPSNTILIEDTGKKPAWIDMTFNLQMYYLNNQIRTGESSGSAHSSTGIPVVFEMNGAEAIEQLQVIKVPYSSFFDRDSADFAGGARMIMSSICSKDFLKMLNHNSTSAQKFNNTYVAGKYLELFEKFPA